MLEMKVLAVSKQGQRSDHWALHRLKEQAKWHQAEATSCRCQRDQTYTAHFQIPNSSCRHPVFLVDPTFPLLPSSDANVEARRNQSHTRFDLAGSWRFANEEPQDHEMRSIFLISEPENGLLELMDELLGQWTCSEIRNTNVLKFDGLDLMFGVLCVDFGRSAENAKGHELARMRCHLQVRRFEKIGAVDKGAKNRQ
jgi:hypothetical protein